MPRKWITKRGWGEQKRLPRGIGKVLRSCFSNLDLASDPSPCNRRIRGRREFGKERVYAVIYTESPWFYGTFFEHFPSFPSKNFKVSSSSINNPPLTLAQWRLASVSSKEKDKEKKSKKEESINRWQLFTYAKNLITRLVPCLNNQYWRNNGRNAEVDIPATREEPSFE